MSDRDIDGQVFNANKDIDNIIDDIEFDEYLDNENYELKANTDSGFLKEYYKEIKEKEPIITSLQISEKTKATHERVIEQLKAY